MYVLSAAVWMEPHAIATSSDHSQFGRIEHPSRQRRNSARAIGISNYAAIPAAFAHCVSSLVRSTIRQSHRDCHGGGENGGQVCRRFVRCLH